MISALLLAAATALPTPQTLPTVTVAAPNATLTLQVAKTEAERERGLMSVTKLRAHTGMVFVFDQEAQADFWMKDTLIPLDMIWVGANGVVNSVSANVPTIPLDMPDNKIPLIAGKGKFVVELAAGEAAKDGIVPGAHLNELIPLHT